LLRLVRYPRGGFNVSHRGVEIIIEMSPHEAMNVRSFRGTPSYTASNYSMFSPKYQDCKYLMYANVNNRDLAQKENILMVQK
jgi:hypothetical protein